MRGERKCRTPTPTVPPSMANSAPHWPLRNGNESPTAAGWPALGGAWPLVWRAGKKLATTTRLAKANRCAGFVMYVRIR